MMNRFFHIALVFLLFVAFTNNSNAHEKPTLVMVNSNWAPYKDSTLPKGGIITHLTKEALKRAGYHIEMVNAPWKRALGGAYKGRYDIVPAIWFTKERAAQLAYGPGLLSTKLVIVSLKKKKTVYESLEDLKGKRVGVGSGWAYPEPVKKATGFIKEEAKDLESNIRKLLLGRLDAIIAEELATRHTILKIFGEKARELKYSSFALDKKDLHVAFSKKTPHVNEIKDRFSHALDAMKKDGSYNEILKFHGLGHVETVKSKSTDLIFYD